MSEPPILPNPNDPSNENPFAPSYVGTFSRGAAKSRLDSSYWIAFAVLIIGSVVLFLIGFPLSWLAIFATIAAAIRVPFLQRRHVTGSGDVHPDLPSPLLLLFTSLALNSLFIIVAFIAFATICIPGTIAFGFGDASYRVVGISGIIGILSFCLMFFLSLRLRV